MILVRVELHSAITGNVTELARMSICNTGENTNSRRGDYTTAVFRGRDSVTLTQNMLRFFRSRDEAEATKAITRKGKVQNHARLQEHVWNLVAKALSGMGYGVAKS